MKKRMTLIVAALTGASLLLAACGSEGNGDADKGSTVKARFPHHMQAETLDGICIQDFADQVADSANVEFEITPAGALGGEADVEENLFQGVFQATLMSTVLMGVWEPSAQVLNLPYVIPNIEIGRELLNSDIVQPLYDNLLENKGARVLGWCHYSERNVGATVPVRKPADLEGIKIRVPETDAFVKTFNALGANPTALPFPEVYNSMKTGLVDAAESNFADMLALKLNEVAPYFSATAHMFTGQAIVVNEEWFQSLSSEQQQALMDAAKKAEDTSFEERVAQNEAVISDMKEQGVTHVDDVDLEAFDKAVAATRDELAAEYGVEDLLIAVREFVAARQ